MRPTEKKIHQLIQNLNEKTRPELDEKILSDCFAELDKRHTPNPVQRPSVWRLFMHSKITKPIAAAMIIVAAVLSITLFDIVVTPAYAIEQTVEALQSIRNLRMVMTNGGIATEVLMLINPQTGLADHIRIDNRGTGDVTITIPGQSYVYSKQNNEVMLLAQELARNDLNFKDVINSLIEQTNAVGGQIKITRGPNELAKKEVIAVTIIRKDQSMAGQFLIDPETNLPIYMGLEAGGQLNYMGPFEYNVEIPENIFEFIIPEGAKVNDTRPEELKNRKPQDAQLVPFDLAETAKAMKTAHNGYAEWVDRKGRHIKTWAKIDPMTQKIDKMRLEYEDGGLYIIADGKTYFEDDGMKGIKDGQYMKSGLLFNNFIAAIAQKLPADSQMTIEKHFSQEFQREVAVVDIKQPWMELQAVVDMDTKLPIKFSIPRTEDMTEPLDHTELIKYNIDLPQGVFDFKTDPNTIILGKQLDTQFANDPNYGIPYDNDEDIQDVCQRVAATYLKAKIDGDIETIKQLHSCYINRYGTSKMIEQLGPTNSGVIEILSIGQAYEYEHPSRRQVPCRVIKERNNQQEECLVGVLVYLRQHEGQKSAVVIGYFPNLQGNNVK